LKLAAKRPALNWPDRRIIRLASRQPSVALALSPQRLGKKCRLLVAKGHIVLRIRPMEIKRSAWRITAAGDLQINYKIV
jgi:hypothetical protein